MRGDLGDPFVAERARFDLGHLGPVAVQGVWRTSARLTVTNPLVKKEREGGVAAAVPPIGHVGDETGQLLLGAADSDALFASRMAVGLRHLVAGGRVIRSQLEVPW